MVEREYNYIRGNNAIAPNRKYSPNEERVDKGRIVRKTPKVQTYKIKKIKGLVGISWLIFLLGGLTVGSYGSLYEVQNQLTNTKAEIKTVEASNEALRVNLLEYYSIYGLKDTAEKNEMILPNKADTIEVKWSKDYFENIQ